jgi:hypothetical protein
MLGEKEFQTSATLPLLRNWCIEKGFKLILEDLDSKGYLLDSAIGEGIQILDLALCWILKKTSLRAQELQRKLTSSKTLLLLRKRSVA